MFEECPSSLDRHVKRARRARNPPWERDELILLLNLYLRHRPGTVARTHPELVSLSRTLNALPLHSYRPDETRFRNANGVHMELANFLALDPEYHGTGLRRVGRLHRQVWQEFSKRPEELERVAAAIKRAHRSVNSEPADIPLDDEETTFPEGRILYRLHRARERSRALLEKAKMTAVKDGGRLACQACGFDFATTYGSLGTGFIECHHLLPLSQLEGQKHTRVTDLALVCANCHRMLHRHRPWLSRGELGTLLPNRR